jgi:hypothetical protein
MRPIDETSMRCVEVSSQVRDRIAIIQIRHSWLFLLHFATSASQAGGVEGDQTNLIYDWNC